jgi:hypothetical protein
MVDSSSAMSRRHATGDESESDDVQEVPLTAVIRPPVPW